MSLSFQNNRILKEVINPTFLIVQRNVWIKKYLMVRSSYLGRFVPFDLNFED
jgi:hypothetical protein